MRMMFDLCPIVDKGSLSAIRIALSQLGGYAQNKGSLRVSAIELLISHEKRCAPSCRMDPPV
jgi:hypothetical protein